MRWVFGAMTTPIFSAYSCGNVGQTPTKKPRPNFWFRRGFSFIPNHSTIQFPALSRLLLLSETLLMLQQDLRYLILAT